MANAESPHLRLQQQIDCYLEVKPRPELESWEADGWKEEPGTDSDEAPLKYIALVLLESIGERATRVSMDREAGVTVYADSAYTLPKAPESYIARGLEILREITGIEGPTGEGKLALGIRSDSLELIIQKVRGTHIINIPGIAELSE